MEPDRIRRRLAALLLGGALGAAALPAPAQAARAYTSCADVPGASLVQAARVSCAVAEEVAAATSGLDPAGELAALTAAGWTPTRAVPAADGEHDVVAVRGLAALRLRLSGEAPDLDGWAAGRELVFARGTIVGGKPIPRGASACTSSFLVRLAGRLGGLSAAHCAGQRSDGGLERRNTALRRPPVPGIVLGRVLRALPKSDRLDALALPVRRTTTRPAVPIVDRGVARPPWIVAGSARPLAGREVCYSGRTSGIDQCGRMLEERDRDVERFISAEDRTEVRCTTITARSGDSGGPVYTAPRRDGTVRAIGIVTLVFGQRQFMCFTPLAPVLDRLDATLVTGAAA